EEFRDLALGYMAAARSNSIDTMTAADQVLSLLQDYLHDAQDDLEAWEARAWALLVRGRDEEALAAAEKALTMNPRGERPLFLALSGAQRLGEAKRALDYARRLVEANHQQPMLRAILTRLLVEAGAWDEVRRQAEAWLRLAPEDAEARMTMVRCLLRE